MLNTSVHKLPPSDYDIMTQFMSYKWIETLSLSPSHIPPTLPTLYQKLSENILHNIYIYIYNLGSQEIKIYKV